jgi:hypothetical protein
MSSERSDRIAARLIRAAEARNGYPAAAPEFAPGVAEGRPRAVPDLPPGLPEEREWDERVAREVRHQDERVAREVRHQEVIEASFDRAEAYARLGDFDLATEWLDRAAAVSGGLPPAYRAQRARWARTTRLAQAGAGTRG